MLQKLVGKVGSWVARTPLAYFPVRIRRGLAKGARWTLLPYSMYWRGNTESDVDAAIGRQSSLKGAVCWDLGTHFGIYTVGMAMAVGPTGQVVGFEPDEVSFRRCRHHVRINRLEWVKLYNVAVGKEAGTADLILHQGAGATTSHLAYEGEKPPSAERMSRVSTVALDALVERGEIRPANFIKIDIEGQGGEALLGARKTIEQNRPVIVMSFHSGVEVRETRAVLEPLGYEPSECETGKPVDWPGPDFHGTLLFQCTGTARG